MANNYTKILELANKNNMGLSNTIKRDYGIPLDYSSVQETYEAALNYAKTSTLAYIGQPISVGDALYIVTDEANGYLKPVGLEGEEGKSAYELYKQAHPEYSGTLEDWLDSLKGATGERGDSGVYVGSGDMPADCNVQIDPEGSVISQYDLVKPTVDSIINNLVEGYYLKDSVTGQYYKLFTSDGKLTMEPTEAPNIEVGDGISNDYNKTVIPEYWEQSIQDAEEKISALADKGGANVTQFVWASDPHCYPNHQVLNSLPNGGQSGTPKNIGKVANKLMNDLNIPQMVVTGDLVNGVGMDGTTPIKINVDEFFKVFVNPVGTNRFMPVLGNHDDTFPKLNEDGSYTHLHLTREERFNWYMRPFSADISKVWGDSDYYYVDIQQNKIRYIVLSGHNVEYEMNEDRTSFPNIYACPEYGYEQLKWLADTLKNTPDDYGVVVFSHYQPDNDSVKDNVVVTSILNTFVSKTSYSTNVFKVNFTNTYGNGKKASHCAYVNSEEDAITEADAIYRPKWGKHTVDSVEILEGIDANFAGCKSTLCAMFAGHVHSDLIDINSFSFPCIRIASAGNSTNKTFVTDSDQETCFDVVTINKKNKKIYMTRLGVGSDRITSYKTHNLIVNGGTGSGVYVNSALIKSTFSEIPEGQEFAYWTDTNGDIVSYAEEYLGFAIKDLTLTPNFVPEGRQITKPVITRVDLVDTEYEDTKIRFYTSWAVPEEYEIVKAGIVGVEQDKYNEETFNIDTTDTNVMVKVSPTSSASSSNAYAWTKSKMNTAECRTWILKSYVQYKDTSDNVVTVYSDKVTATWQGDAVYDN